MILFYSGVGHSFGNPEITLGDRANLMLTYHTFWTMSNKPDKRFERILKVRKLKKKKKSK